MVSRQVDIDISHRIVKLDFKILVCKITNYLLPWKPFQNIQFHYSMQNVYIYLYPQNLFQVIFVSFFVVSRHPCLANQKPCVVTMTSRWYTDLENLWRRLQYGIWNMCVALCESCLFFFKDEAWNCETTPKWLTTGKIEKKCRQYLSCYCHDICRVEAVGLKILIVLLKNTIFVNIWDSENKTKQNKTKQNKNPYFINNRLLKLEYENSFAHR